MVEKTVTIEKKEEKTQKPQKRKAAVGAWWKSTTEDPKTEQTPTKEKTAKASTASTTRKKSSKASSTKSTTASKRKTPSAKKSAASTEDSAETARPSKAKSPRKKATGTKNSSTEAVAAAPEPKKPARKRSPRKKKTVEDSVSSTAVESAVEDKSVVAEKKPARKRTPRKKKTTAVAESKPVETSVKPVAAEAVEEQEAPKPKTPRKRAPRKTPAKKTSDPKKEVKEEAEDSANGETVEITETTEAKPKQPRKRAPRKRSPRKPRKQAVEAIADEAQAETDSPPVETVTPVEEDSVTEVKKADGEEPTAEGNIKTEETTKPATSQEKNKEEKQGPKPVIKLLINAEEPEECRLALLEDGRLESIHVATSTRAQTKNNIYKARIVAIEANLQAAFVDYGTDKNGFLPFSEIHPEYYKQEVSEKIQKLIDQHQWKKLSITDVVEKGQEVLVQVVKEEVGNKGANMTTFLSLPGRCVVLMPGSDSTGISRKISGEERRSQLREVMKGMEIPEGIGWIVRTASIDINKTALARDVGYLLRLWEEVKKKGQVLDGVGLIYQDHNHVLRFLREHFDPDIQEILVDDKEALEQVKGFVELLPTKQRNVRIKLHRGARPIFNQYSIEDQIESIYQPRVNLPSGGSIVIDPTEALVAIDVNSGSTSRGHNFEESIFQANKEAAKELARQLRLRDLGGLVVVDFIDMRSKKNIREIERFVKVAMKRDKAKVDISRISKFGLMQISRQKLGAPIEAGNYRVCTHCKGRGIVRSVETLALYYLRRIHTGATRKVVNQIECRFPLDVAQYLLNYKRNELRDLEAKYNAEVIIIAEPSFKPADNEIIFHKLEKNESGKKRS